MELAEALIKRELGPRAVLPLLLLIDVIVAPLTIALDLTYVEVVLEGQTIFTAFRIAWSRGVASDVRRAWLYGSTITLTTLFFAMAAGLIGAFIDSLMNLHFVFYRVLFSVAYAVAVSVASAFILSFAEALRARYAGTDLEASIDALG